MVKKWWNDKVAYQIYPKSFCDTNGDGIGDLRGVISKLDYLKELGIDIIWLSPIYQSPFVDQGYDISDYYKIAEEFGTMEEFDELLSEAKKRDMYIVMDLVVNHCSDKHEWFQKALENPDGEYADYFYFVKGKDGKAPSNYRASFGGSASTTSWTPGRNWSRALSWKAVWSSTRSLTSAMLGLPISVPVSTTSAWAAGPALLGIPATSCWLT